MEIDYVMPAMPRLIRRPQARRDARPLWMTLRAVDPELARNTPLIAADHRWLISCNDLLATELDELSGIGRAFRQPHPLVTDVLAHLSKPDPSAAVPSE